MQPELFTRENIHTLPFPSTEDGDYARRYLIPLMSDDSQKYIRNVHNTQLMAVKASETVFPITITDFHPQNTYTVSPYSHYVSYGGLEEVKHLNNKIAEIAVKALMFPVAAFFKYSELDKVVFVNNYLLSTNLYPSVNSDQIKALSAALVTWFPDRAIVFRSVDQKKNPHIYRTLAGLGYDLVLSRQVWYMDPVAALKTRQCKEDLRVLRRNGYEAVDGKDLSDEELRRAVELYDLLYLEKYSYFNPQFTFEFLRLARDENILHMVGLKKDGRLNGIMGFFIRNGAMTQPLFGYDTSLPMEEGLYRLLTLVTLQAGVQRGLLVHASGGVGRFKKVRGGESVTEYNAVYTKHLPRRRQLPWKLIGNVSDRAIPYFKKMDF
ncbi:MAG TPA: GNAT family N-acetyltransferase [Anaerolineales bacterium]|nr:GNAT family N-acetyltransferase [Anaerolineales bacterium]HNN14533.1 GNAT family N-acetyltransferase [Anaerolineales bacterium]